MNRRMTIAELKDMGWSCRKTRRYIWGVRGSEWEVTDAAGIRKNCNVSTHTTARAAWAEAIELYYYAELDGMK